MKYSIVVSKSTEFRDEILKQVKAAKDANGVSIDTWETRSVTFMEKDGTKTVEDVLVHTTQAWAETGCVRLVADKESLRHVHAQFYYWDSFPKEQRDGTHAYYLLGRLTELILVHFNSKITSVMITQN